MSDVQKCRQVSAVNTKILRENPDNVMKWSVEVMAQYRGKNT